MFKFFKVCVALITYTLFLKATNHLARERAFKGQREIGVVSKFLTPDGAWCWFADPRAVYYEGMLVYSTIATCQATKNSLNV